jgi:hypothetical protein
MLNPFFLFLGRNRGLPLHTGEWNAGGPFVCPAKPFSQLVYPEAMTLNGTDPSKIGPTERMQDRAW